MSAPGGRGARARPGARALAAAAVASVAASLAGGAAGITLDEFRASWARSPRFPRSNSIDFSQAALTAWDFSLGLCSMETWQNDWRVRPARVAPRPPPPPHRLPPPPPPRRPPRWPLAHPLGPSLICGAR